MVTLLPIFTLPIIVTVAPSETLSPITGRPFLPYNRNGVLFPKKINGEYVMLSRPSDTGHTKFGDIFISRSKDMIY